MRRFLNLLLKIPLVCVFSFPSSHALCQEVPRQGTPNYDVPIHGHGSYLDSPDGRLYYETEGIGSTIVVIAGGPGGDHTSFHPFFSRLAKDHRVVYFDNIGRGRSEKLADKTRYTVWRDAEDVEQLRRMLGEERITVVGHSYGGMPALAYALTYPQHVDHLVLSDTLHSGEGFQQNIDGCNFFASHQYPEQWAKVLALRRKGVKSSDPKYTEVYGPLNSLYWYDEKNGERMFRSGENSGFNNDVYLAMLGDDPEWVVKGTMHDYDPRKRMKNLHVPTLICVGRWDRVAMPKVALEMKSLLPEDSSHLIVFEKSGHRPWVEETDLYFSIVEDFLHDRLKEESRPVHASR